MASDMSIGISFCGLAVLVPLGLVLLVTIAIGTGRARQNVLLFGGLGAVLIVGVVVLGEFFSVRSLPAVPLAQQGSAEPHIEPLADANSPYAEQQRWLEAQPKLREARRKAALELARSAAQEDGVVFLHATTEYRTSETGEQLQAYYLRRPHGGHVAGPDGMPLPVWYAVGDRPPLAVYAEGVRPRGSYAVRTNGMSGSWARVLLPIGAVVLAYALLRVFVRRVRPDAAESAYSGEQHG